MEGSNKLREGWGVLLGELAGLRMPPKAVGPGQLWREAEGLHQDVPEGSSTNMHWRAECALTHTVCLLVSGLLLFKIFVSALSPTISSSSSCKVAITHFEIAVSGSRKGS